MNATAAPVFYFDTEDATRYAHDPDVCSICGERGTSVRRDRPKPHNAAMHEVFYFLRCGMHAVCYPARPFVEAWASGSAPLPSNEEYFALPNRED